MAQNFLSCDRDQQLLLPPSLREWLPEDHFAWFVLDSVAELDLDGFYAAYRADGWGAAAHDPQMMVALLLYAYALGCARRAGSSAAAREDVAFRVITANQVPDHATIARFRRPPRAGDRRALSARARALRAAGLVQVGIVAIDGTKVAAAATHHANRSYEQIAREILEEAGRTDAAEDELYGEARGDELPEGLRSAGDRRRWLREAKQALEAERARRRRRFRATARAPFRVQGPARAGLAARAAVVAEHAAWHARGSRATARGG